jgi:hypothetical protein
MLRHGPKLEREQLLLGRFVDIGTELFAIAATCARAQSMQSEGDTARAREALELADYFCRAARLRIERHFQGVHHNADRAGYRLAKRVLEGGVEFVEHGVVSKPFGGG